MKRTMRGALIMLGTLVTAVPVYGHHSFPATYFIDQQVTIEGTVVQFLFRNPHSIIQVMAPDAEGKMQRWAVEWAAAGALSRGGAGRDTLKVNDRVIIVGNPGRNPSEHRLRLNSIERPADGWKWSGEFD